MVGRIAARFCGLLQGQFSRVLLSPQLLEIGQQGPTDARAVYGDTELLVLGRSRLPLGEELRVPHMAPRSNAASIGSLQRRIPTKPHLPVFPSRRRWKPRSASLCDNRFKEPASSPRSPHHSFQPQYKCCVNVHACADSSPSSPSQRPITS